MARAAAQYLIAALLALLSAHTAVPSRHLESPAKVVWCAETEQQAAELVRPVRIEHRERLATVPYTSCIAAPPDTAALFQRPPPFSSLFV